MTEIITWCNDNNGFLTAILTLVGLLLSVIAIVVSIRTARLPYKKSIKLSSSYSILFTRNELTGLAGSSIVGITVNATNTGSRNIKITYLGLTVKDKSLGKNPMKMTKIRDAATGIGTISPSEELSELYDKNDLLYSFSKVSPHAEVCIYALDSEGQEYIKKMGHVQKLIKGLSQE